MDAELINHLAGLSKLSFEDDELKQMMVDMENIIKLMDSIKDADTNSVPFMHECKKYDDLRNDLPNKSFERDEILKNAKIVEKSNFAVPKVM